MAPAPLDPATGAVSFRLLGPLAAFQDAGTPAQHELDLGRPKQRAVLALLLLQRGRIVAADRLIDATWGGEPPPSALASLQAYVSNLRRVLRGQSGTSSPIVRRAPGYVLDVPPDAVDVDRFAQATQAARAAAEADRWPEALAAAERALAVWQGAVLADLRDEPWVRSEADALEELRTECRELAISASLATGRVAPALVAAQQLRAAQPLRDRACWLHLLALHRAGRSPEALDEYRAYARRLDDELGLEPGPELRELELGVLRHDPALLSWPLSDMRGLPGPAAAASPVPARVLPAQRERLVDARTRPR